MENKVNILEKNVLDLLNKYQNSLESGVSEAFCDNILDIIEDIAQNSDFNDLMFHGEKDRSFEEIAREVAIREIIFVELGIMGVYERILLQMNGVLELTSTAYVYRRNAQRKKDEILELKRGVVRLQ